MKLRNLFHGFGGPTLGLAVAGAISVLCSQSASAQGITVSTPPFSVEGQHSANGAYQYPGGTYQFTRVSEWLLSIRNVNSGKETLFLIRPEVNGPLGVHGGLVFDTSKGARTLQTVYIPGTDMAAELVGGDMMKTRAKGHLRQTSTTSLRNKAAIGKRDATGQ